MFDLFYHLNFLVTVFIVGQFLYNFLIKKDSHNLSTAHLLSRINPFQIKF